MVKDRKVTKQSVDSLVTTRLNGYVSPYDRILYINVSMTDKSYNSKKSYKKFEQNLVSGEVALLTISLSLSPIKYFSY